MTAGRRDTLISFETADTVQDDYGEETLTWAEVGQEWAAVYYGRGDERRQAAAEQGAQAAVFQVLSNGVTRGITIKDRIVRDGEVWDIVGLAPDSPTRRSIEFTATRAL